MSKVIKVSLEEFEHQKERFNVIPFEIDSQIQEVCRTMDIVRSLESLDEITSGIKYATSAESRLIQVTGDLVVSGSGLTSNDLVPALEQFGAGAVSVEESDFKEKIQKIYKAIREAVRKVWLKIMEFFQSSNFVLGSALNKVRKLDEQLVSMKSLIAGTDRLGLDTNEIRNILLPNTQLGVILNDGEYIINNPKDIGNLLSGSLTMYRNYFDKYTRVLTDIGEHIVKTLDRVTEDNIHDVCKELMKDLNNGLINLQNVVSVSANLSSIDGSKITPTFNSVEGPNVHLFRLNILGTPVIKVNRIKLADYGEDYVSFFDILKQTSIKLAFVDATKLKLARELETPYTLEEMRNLNLKTEDLLKEIDHFKNKVLTMRIEAIMKKILLASDKMDEKLYRSKDSKVLSASKALLGLNVAFVNWTRYPLVELVYYGIRVQRTIQWLIKQNIKIYRPKNKEEKKETK